MHGRGAAVCCAAPSTNLIADGFGFRPATKPWDRGARIWAWGCQTSSCFSTHAWTLRLTVKTVPSLLLQRISRPPPAPEARLNMELRCRGGGGNVRIPGQEEILEYTSQTAYSQAVARRPQPGAPMLDSLAGQTVIRGHHGQQRPVQQQLETQQAAPSPRAPCVRPRAPAASPRVRVLVGSSKRWYEYVLQQSPTCAKLRTDANTVHSNGPFHLSGTPTEAELQRRAMSTMWHHVLAVPHLPIDDALATSPSNLALHAGQVGQAAGQVTWQNAQKDDQWMPNPDDARRLRQSVRSRVGAAARAGHPLFWSANAEDVEDEHGDEEERRQESPRPPSSPASPRAHSSFRPIRAPSSPASPLSSPSTPRGATPPWGWQNTNRVEGHLFEKDRPASAPAARTSCAVQQRVASAPSTHRQTLSAHVSALPSTACACPSSLLVFTTALLLFYYCFTTALLLL